MEDCKAICLKCIFIEEFEYANSGVKPDSPILRDWYMCYFDAKVKTCCVTGTSSFTPRGRCVKYNSDGQCEDFSPKPPRPKLGRWEKFVAWIGFRRSITSTGITDDVW